MKGIYLFCMIWALAFASCADDKGNYDYTPIDEVTISGIDANYTSLIGDDLSIPVTLEHSIAGSSEDYEYLWEMAGKKIADTRDLNIPTPSEFGYGSKKCRYIITDKKSGMKFFKAFTINISSPFNWGYYFLIEKEDHSSVLSYFPVTTEEKKFIETNAIGGVELGNRPRSLTGKFGYIESLKDDYWTITVLTQEGENPVIVTENGTFIPNNIVNTSCFIDQDAGYVFAPEVAANNRQGDLFFISQGKFINYNEGLLYRPARHDKEYYWSNPIWSQSGWGFMFVFDQLSQKYYTLQVQPNVPEQGIVGDSYAYDKVVEIKDCPSFEGMTILANMPELGSPADLATVAIAGGNEIHLVKLSYAMSTFSGKCDTVQILPLAGAGANSRGLLLGKDWYFSVKNKIYTSPTLLPKIRDFVVLPEKYGDIICLGNSAMKSVMVVATYNENSSEPLKGSVIFIDMQTKETVVYENVIGKCVSILGCNTDPYGWGDYGDGK